MESQIFELQYAMDTFYFLICGALVMWMAAGFSMLEAGLVRSKNTTEILTKNVSLFAVSCIMSVSVLLRHLWTSERIGDKCGFGFPDVGAGGRAVWVRGVVSPVTVQRHNGVYNVP